MKKESLLIKMPLTDKVLIKAKENGKSQVDDFHVEYKTNGWYVIHDNKGWAHYVGPRIGAADFLDKKLHYRLA